VTARAAARGPAWRTLARAALAVLLASLAACASLPPPAAGVLGYSGKFSLRVTGDERQDVMSGRFALTVDPDGVTLDLSTPLGTTVARIRSGADGATLSVPASGGLRTEHGPDPDALCRQVLGWSLPVGGIRDWIEGRPVPGRPYRLSAADDGGSRLEQDGWTIRLDPRGADGRIRHLDLERERQVDAPSVWLRVVLDAEAGR
jgi:outer membrane lipoprotein LolB